MLAVTAFDVQRGNTQRSYVRYVDITFNQAGDVLQELVSASRMRLMHYDLNGENGREVSLTPSTRLDFSRHAKTSRANHTATRHLATD
jgi:hypothetical protein